MVSGGTWIGNRRMQSTDTFKCCIASCSGAWWAKTYLSFSTNFNCGCWSTCSCCVLRIYIPHANITVCYMEHQARNVPVPIEEAQEELPPQPSRPPAKLPPPKMETAPEEPAPELVPAGPLTPRCVFLLKEQEPRIYWYSLHETDSGISVAPWDLIFHLISVQPPGVLIACSNSNLPNEQPQTWNATPLQGRRVGGANSQGKRWPRTSPLPKELVLPCNHDPPDHILHLDEAVPSTVLKGPRGFYPRMRNCTRSLGSGRDHSEIINISVNSLKSSETTGLRQWFLGYMANEKTIPDVVVVNETINGYDSMSFQWRNNSKNSYEINYFHDSWFGYGMSTD